MKVLFVYSLNIVESATKPLQSPGQMQFGISYISSFLKKHGHQTKLIVLSRVLSRKNRDLIDEYLKNFYPRVICFTAVSTEYPFITQIAKYIKLRYPDIYLVIGGPHVSLNPDEVLSDGFDALCIGEGEIPILELVSQLENNIAIPPSGIHNLWLKHNSDVERNSPRPFLQELDSLPFPDREMWLEWIGPHPRARHSVILGRGCIFQCSYCCNHALRKLSTGTYFRLRSPENIVEEIKEITTQFPMEKEIYLEVESFGTSKEWAIRVCEKLEELNTMIRHPLSFGVNIRITPNANFEDLFTACKKSNFRFVNIGLESGSERIRRDILRRDYSNQDIINTVALAKKVGLQVALFNMIGIPGETIQDFKETVNVNRICLPDWHFTSIFFPYPGTELYAVCKRQGLLKTPLNTDMERANAVLDLPKFSKRQIKKSYTLFDYYVYKGRKPMIKILALMWETILSSNSNINFFLRRILQLYVFKSVRLAFRKVKKWDSTIRVLALYM